MTYACDIPFLFSTFITPSEKHSANLSASSYSHGLVIVISGRSLYDAVAMERRDNIHCLTPCVRTAQKLPPSRGTRFLSRESRLARALKKLEVYVKLFVSVQSQGKFETHVDRSGNKLWNYMYPSPTCTCKRHQE